MSESISGSPVEPNDVAAATVKQDKSPSNYIRIGFYTALGVLLLTLAALCAYRVLAALADVATPFEVGTFLALLLDPVTHRLERTGLHRMVAILVVVSITLLILIGFGAIVIPRFVEQVSNLASNGPGYIRHMQSSTNGWLLRNHRFGPITLPRSTHDISMQLSQ